MKKWMTPELEELEIAATANAQAESESADGPWVQNGDRWLWPGSSVAE